VIPLHDLLLFAAGALLLVLSPGPNMIYLVSRSICQGRKAGVISLGGVVLGFFVHVLAAAVGLTALLLAIPFGYDVLKWCGAAYLLWLAWNAVRPGARSPFEARALPADPPRKLFLMGFLTNALNPKMAAFYLSVFPQFLAPERGSVFAQGLLLGCTQIAVSFSVNLLIIFFAAKISAWFSTRPTWLSLQRYVMGGVLGGLAVRMALDRRTT
jgi:threonine/homoserine/homoserine lactone efflux protein